MRTLRLVGLSADGSRLVLGDGDARWDLVVDDALVDQVKAARAASAAVPDAPAPTRAPTPREVQERIRRGESAADLARTSGVPLEHVTRYEGPVLAERAHHARLARLSSVGGRPVEELLEEHMQRMAQVGLPLVWDSWLTDSGRWDVLVRCGRVLVRLSWDPTARRVSAVDEAGRRALGLMPAEQDTLSAVLRPVASRALQAAAAPPLEALARAQATGPSDVGSGTPSPAPSSPPLSPAATVQAPAAQLVLDEMGDAGAVVAPAAGSAQAGPAGGAGAADEAGLAGGGGGLPAGTEVSGGAVTAPAVPGGAGGRPAGTEVSGGAVDAPAAAHQEAVGAGGRPTGTEVSGRSVAAAAHQVPGGGGGGLPGGSDLPGLAPAAPRSNEPAGVPAAPAAAPSRTGLPGAAAAVAAGRTVGSVRVSPADRVAARTAAAPVGGQGADERVGADAVRGDAAAAVAPTPGVGADAPAAAPAGAAPVVAPTTAAQEVTPLAGAGAVSDSSDAPPPGDPAAGTAAAEPEVPPRPAPPRPPVGPPRPGSRQGGRPKRAQVPTWDDISGASTGRTGPPRRGAS